MAYRLENDVHLNARFLGAELADDKVTPLILQGALEADFCRFLYRIERTPGTGKAFWVGRYFDYLCRRIQDRPA